MSLPIVSNRDRTNAEDSPFLAIAGVRTGGRGGGVVSQGRWGLRFGGFIIGLYGSARSTSIDAFNIYNVYTMFTHFSVETIPSKSTC